MSISSSIVFGHKSDGMYVKTPYPASHQALSRNLISKLAIPKCKDQANLREYRRNSFVVYANSSVPGDSSSSKSPPPRSSKKNWILGMVLSFMLPFFTHRKGPIWVLKDRIENAVQTVEDVVEAVEKVAEEVDKIAESVGHDLPDGKLKDMAKLVEDMAEKTAKTADSLDKIIDKVQEAEERIMESVESSKKERKHQ